MHCAGRVGVEAAGRHAATDVRDHIDVVDALAEMDVKSLASRNEADKLLSARVADPQTVLVRVYDLFTNLFTNLFIEVNRFSSRGHRALGLSREKRLVSGRP